MTISAPILKDIQQWLDEAIADERVNEPTAMNLATASVDAIPTNRIVLLKGLDENGLVFYSNGHSRKGDELTQNPYASLCFYWMPMKRQIRVEGRVEEVSNHLADAYFSSRPRESQIGAWASQQSQPMDSPDIFQQRIAQMTARFDGQDVPRPPHWKGWRLLPTRIEFWQEKEFRLHDRWEFIRQADDSWNRRYLFP